jgi:putative methyltransferase (TIGR04325 family)
MAIKSIIKELLPPLIFRFAVKLYKPKYGWSGNYASWQDAVNDSAGYDAPNIVEKVKDALLKVKNGEVAFERDSVLFDKIEYSWPMLAGLMWVASRHQQLSVADFGGSLGSSYFQNRKFLGHLKALKWGVIEQPLFVDYGKKYFEDSTLKFYPDFETCWKMQQPQVILFPCVLQYMEDPFAVLKNAFSYSPEYIIVDNMPFLRHGKKIMVQTVPPDIYPASYPCWLLNKTEFVEFFASAYDMIADFKSDLAIKVGDEMIPYEGFIFKKK